MSDETELDQISRYIFGECEPDEGRAVEHWIDTDPERRAVAESFRRIRDAAAATRVVDVEAAWMKVAAPRPAPATPRRAHFRLDGALFPDAGRARRRTWLRWASAIAAVLLAVAGAVFLGRVVPGSPQPAVMREAATLRGERASFTLSDGTRVILGAESRLRFPRAFGRGGRGVFLDGEAYFDVARDATRPFAVHSAGAVTRVLGTRFGVRAYGGGEAVQVVVAEGRVAVAPDSVRQGVVLLRGMLGLVAPDGRTVVRQQVDVDDYLGWIEGQLAFHDTPLPDVARRLARWYDLDVQIADSSLNELLLTATFEHEPVDDVLHVIASSLDVQYQRTGRSVRFLPKRPGAPR